MKVILSLFVLLVFLLGAAMVGPSFVDWNAYKSELTQKVALVSGLDVVIDGDVSLAILPSPRIYIEDVKVSNPQVKASEIASFKMLDVRVGLGALLNKRLEVTKVRLEQPVVRLVEGVNGRFNYMTSQIEAMVSLSDQTGDGGKPSDLSVSFDGVEILNGSFLYQSKSGITEVSKLNFDLQADQLLGPFKGQGDFVYAGRRIAAEIKTGALDTDLLSSTLNLRASIDDMDVSFAGVVSGGAETGAQGELSLGVKSFGEFVGQDALKGDLQVRGFLSAGLDKVSFKDAVIALDEQRMTGQVSVGMKPVSVAGAFKMQDALNLDQFLGQKGGGANSGSPLALVEALPQTLELPQLGNIELSFLFPKVVYKGQNFDGLQLDASKMSNGFKLKARLAGIPGDGVLNVDTDLSFAEKSSSGKTNTDIYSGASIDVRVKGQAQNLPVAIDALSGMSGLPLIHGSRIAVFEFDSTISSLGMFLNKGVVNIDKDAYAITGSLKGQSNSTADLLKLSFVADVLDVGRVMGTSGGAKPENQTHGSVLPFDVEIDAKVHKVVLPDQNISGLRLGAKLKGQKFLLHKFEADDFAGQKLTVNGLVSVDMSQAKPFLQGDVNLGDLVWKSSNVKKPKSSGAKWSSEPIASGWLNSVSMDMAVSANSILYEGWNLSKPSLKVVMNDGVLDLQSLKAGLYDGHINASGALRSMSNDAGFIVDGEASVNKVNMEPLVKSLAGTQLLKGRGEVSLSVDARGSGASMKALVASLAGQGRVSGSSIVLDGVDINRFARALSEDAKPGDTVLNLWKGTTGRGSTSFETLDGAYDIKNGVVGLQKLLLDGPRASINTTGQIDLPAWTIKTAHLMSVKDRDDVPPFTVNISGSLDNPGQTFAQGALNDYLSRKIQRKLEKVLGGKLGEKLDSKLGLDGVLNGVLGGTSAPVAPVNDNQEPQQQQEQEAPQQVRPEDVVEDLLKGFLR